MIRPPSLSKGDRVAIVAPARSISPTRLMLAIDQLKGWGYEPVLGPNLYQESNQYAGTDAQRLADLQWAFDDPSIKAVLCARGGYGTLRILDGLDLRGIKKHPKWVIGFSDITALLVRLYNEGIQSIHAPMGISFDGSTGDVEAIYQLGRMLKYGFGGKIHYTPEREELIRPGKVKGRLLGGNLSILSQLLGTSTDFKTTHTLFFLEDLSEYLYHIDRMMIHLKRAGKMDRLAGLMIGGMTEMKDNDTPFGKDAEQIVVDAAIGEYPICTGFPVGHWPQNYPLILGAEAELEVTHTSVTLNFIQ